MRLLSKNVLFQVVLAAYAAVLLIGPLHATSSCIDPQKVLALSQCAAMPALNDFVHAMNSQRLDRLVFPMLTLIQTEQSGRITTCLSAIEPMPSCDASIVAFVETLSHSISSTDAVQQIYKALPEPIQTENQLQLVESWMKSQVTGEDELIELIKATIPRKDLHHALSHHPKLNDVLDKVVNLEWIKGDMCPAIVEIFKHIPDPPGLEESFAAVRDSLDEGIAVEALVTAVLPYLAEKKSQRFRSLIKLSNQIRMEQTSNAKRRDELWLAGLKAMRTRSSRR